jgi:hypothetical protein
MLCVVPRPAGPVVVQLECAWDRRDAWDSEFYRLLTTFRLR